jgi:hypothetical protein
VKKSSTVIGILLASALLPFDRAGADEITVLSSVGIKAVLDELVPRFEAARP